jgi:hypothetical protein
MIISMTRSTAIAFTTAVLLIAPIAVALMTDLGALIAAAGVAGTRRDGARIRGVSSAAAIGGVALIGASVPIHFSVDAELSRAVWRYNAALASRD